MHSDLNYYPKLYNTLMNSGSKLAISLLHFSDYLVKYSKLVITLFVFSYSRVKLKQFLPEIHNERIK